jgi:hypothetical protein
VGAWCKLEILLPSAGSDRAQLPRLPWPPTTEPCCCGKNKGVCSVFQVAARSARWSSGRGSILIYLARNPVSSFTVTLPNYRPQVPSPQPSPTAESSFHFADFKAHSRQGLQGRWGALTSAPRPAPPGEIGAPRPAPPSAP